MKSAAGKFDAEKVVLDLNPMVGEATPDVTGHDASLS
jgi:hypothetical protein